MTYKVKPYIRTPAPGVMKFTIWVDPSHHYYILSLSDLCTGVKKIFKEIMHFHYMTYMTTP